MNLFGSADANDFSCCTVRGFIYVYVYACLKQAKHRTMRHIVVCNISLAHLLSNESIPTKIGQSEAWLMQFNVQGVLEHLGMACAGVKQACASGAIAEPMLAWSKRCVGSLPLCVLRCSLKGWFTKAFLQTIERCSDGNNGSHDTCPYVML